MTIATASNNSPTVIVSESGQQGIKGTDGTNGTGFNSVRRALLDNPLCHLFKSNKLVETLAGTLTTNRATTGTYVDRYGVIKTAAINTLREEKDGWLIEGASTNLALYSEQIDNAIWTKTGSSITVNAITAPDGNLTADLLTEDTSTAVHRIFQSSTVINGVDETFSFYVKPNGRTSNEMDFSSGELTVFNLTTKVITEANGSKNSKIEVLGNGWFRISTTITTSTTLLTYQLRLHNGSASVYTGDGVSGSYVFGGQLEQLPFASSYISTTTATVTRAADIVNFVYNENHPDLINKSELSYFVNCSSLGIDLLKYPVIINTDNYQFSVLRMNNSNSLSYHRNNSALTTTTFDTTIKFSACVTLSTDTASLYLNGALSGSLTSTPLSELLPTQVNIGTGTGNQLYGHLSDLRIYDFALNQEEVTYLSGV